MRHLFISIAFLCSLCVSAQGVKPLPTLHTEGRWLVDAHGNQVVLHGVMDTPNMYFNGWNWGNPWSDGTNYDSNGATKCLAYFDKLFAGIEKAKCNVFRLHLDPAWTNDPNSNYVYAGSQGQASDASGEADISKFNPSRLESFLSSLYLPLAEKAMKHGLYVVVRPPGVCPGNLKVGDYYQAYLKKVWDIFSKQDFVKQHAGQISIELANEPVSLKNAQGQDDTKALHDYFQPVVDLIRANGFTGIIWVPGTGWQGNYTSYAEHPIEGENIGYAVHDYCGWYGCSDENPDPQNKIDQFHRLVPVVDFAPVIITEVDWSPNKPGDGHYNEHGEWVESNYGTWATGSTSKWGKAYKTMLDHFGNISMTLSGTGCLLDIDQLLKNGSVAPAFGGLAEACGKACMDWYADYYQQNWPHADNEAETGDAYTVEEMKAEKQAYDLTVGDKTFLALKLFYRDGHSKDVSETAKYVIDDASVVSIKHGYLQAIAKGETQVHVSYTGLNGEEWAGTINVKVSDFEISGFTPLTSLAEIAGKHFVILNKEAQKVIYGSDAQNLAYGDPNTVLNNKNISGYQFKAEPIEGRDGCYLLRLIALNGTEYSIWGSPGYLNGYSTVADCSFILGLNNQYGQDVKDGAVWEITYEEGQGFLLKNMYTGKYLHDNLSAKYDAPAYMDFLVAGSTTGISTRKVTADANDDAVYTLQGQKVGVRSQWNSLPRGIYVVNGKKIIK